MAPRSQPLKMGNHQITGVADGTDPDHAVNLSQLDAVEAAAGTVSSVVVSGGTTGLTTSGGPITGSGTITLAGTLDVDNGGTGQTSYTDGQLLIGNSSGNTLTKATLTAGTGISITNGSGSISIATTVPWSVSKKTSDQNLTTSSTSFQDVTSLSFSASANKNYAFRAFISYYSPASGSGGGGIKLGVNGPSSPALVVAGTEITFAASAYDTTAVNIAAQTGATFYTFVLQGVLHNGSNAGTFIVRAAQNSSGASASIVLAGSYIEYMEVA